MSAQMAAQEDAQPAAQRATKRGELGEEIIKHKSAIFPGWLPYHQTNQIETSRRQHST
jgi:hypothetical protein